LNKILFIGDSITESFNTDVFLKEYNIVNKAHYGNSTTETLDILKSFFDIEYDKIFILIGTNDLVRDRTDSEIITNINIIAEICKKESPTAKLHIISILPVRNLDNRDNDRINRLNLQLNEICKLNNYVYYNLNSLIKDNNGNLKQEFTEDGLHLNEKAYLFWSENITQYL